MEHVKTINVVYCSGCGWKGSIYFQGKDEAEVHEADSFELLMESVRASVDSYTPPDEVA